MNYLKLKQKIYEAIERNPFDRSAYEEMFAVCREYEKIDFQTAHAWNHELRNHISWGLRMTVSCQKFDEAREFDDLMFRSLLFGAQHFFDDYLQAVEYGKPLDKKFYQPRRHYLRITDCNTATDSALKAAATMMIVNDDTGKTYQGVIKVIGGKPVFEYDEVVTR